jgi:hypothetical protein
MMNSSENEKLKEAGIACGGRGRFWLRKVPFIMLAIGLIIIIKSAIVLLLWNALIPGLFHGPLLTYPQALGLTVLIKLLFGFPRFGPFSGRRWGSPWKARWAALSPEEREKLREEIRRRCWGEASA